MDWVLQEPQQKIPQPGGKCIYQAQVDFGGAKIYLLRAVVAEDRDPPVVVTVYRTSKIDKYWRPA